MGVISCGTTMLDQGQFQNLPVVNWQTGSIKTSGFTATSGEGYFCNTSGGAFTVTLPASPSAGNIVAVKDYANTFDTNTLTIGRNGSNIGGLAVDSSLQTEGLAVTLIYVDATKGWLVVSSGLQDEAPGPAFVAATGGTITTSGDYKIHTFTSPGTFCVSNAGNAAGSNAVDYLVVAGGGGGGASTGPNRRGGGGAGAGGFRETAGCGYTSSPLGACVAALPVSATGYPITVGAGGAGGTGANKGANGSNSIFTTITSTGGGGGTLGGFSGHPSCQYVGQPGGSGGGLGSTSGATRTEGAGNTPPVSPSQGFPGGGPRPCGDYLAGNGGGGATAAGSPLQGVPGTPNFNGGAGGAGATTNITASPVTYAVGAQGGDWNSTGPSAAGGANTGTGGAGSGAGGDADGSAGGSGIVVIRYKFQ